MEKFGGTERQRREREKVENMRRVEKQKQRENNVRQRVAEIEKIRVESKTTEKTQISQTFLLDFPILHFL